MYLNQLIDKGTWIGLVTKGTWIGRMIKGLGQLIKDTWIGRWEGRRQGETQSLQCHCPLKIVSSQQPTSKQSILSKRKKLQLTFWHFLKETSDQRDELVICTESESQGFPVGEEGAVNREEKQPEKMKIPPGSWAMLRLVWTKMKVSWIRNTMQNTWNTTRYTGRAKIVQSNLLHCTTKTGCTS